MEESSSSRMDWLIRFRWMIGLSGVILTLAADCLLPGVLPLRAILATIAGLALWNAVLLLYVRRLSSVPGLARWHNPLTQVQLGLDPLFLTLFLHFFGGLETPFFFFYLIYVVIASIHLSRRASLAYAGLVSLLYAALLLLEWRRIIPHHNLAGFRVSTRFQQPIHIVTTSLTLTSTAFLTAHFASGMVATLRARGGELMEARLACEGRAQQLSEANAKLEELDEMRSRFIHLVTHELKAPVAAIQSYLRLILEGTVPPERTRDILQRAEQRALGQLALIGDLLDLARLEEPRAQVELEWLDQSEVLCGVIELMRGQAEEAGVSLRVDIPLDAPVMSANRDHMCYLWANVIGNAIKYTPRGGCVSVSLTNGADEIVGTVQDTGIGIPLEDLRRIYDEFYRAENAKAMESHGTGLGLSIAERVVKAYGGRIWAESKLGEGSTFTFILAKDSPRESATYSAVITSGPTAGAD
jgi:signal transduction histidine kinase